ncbi:SirB2 family protein [Denitrificimonas caeni]|uniref:SirB2 family protein n=1 Tax=Denitrificimonas caeni TaxID=521720 RepID=UPI0003B65B01|nr:SirB2 family protein [Denitrificimonas caeni]
MLVENYQIIKNIHIGLALLSGSLFAVRGLWVLIVGSGAPLQRSINRVSYVVDTGLLIAALLLMIIFSFAPLSMAWLQAKLFLLVLYVGFGALAFRVKYSLQLRWLAYLIALLCFIGMYYSARLHQPFAGIFS